MNNNIFETFVSFYYFYLDMWQRPFTDIYILYTYMEYKTQRVYKCSHTMIKINHQLKDTKVCRKIDRNNSFYGGGNIIGVLLSNFVNYFDDIVRY